MDKVSKFSYEFIPITENSGCPKFKSVLQTALVHQLCQISDHNWFDDMSLKEKGSNLMEAVDGWFPIKPCPPPTKKIHDKPTSLVNQAGDKSPWKRSLSSRSARFQSSVSLRPKDLPFSKSLPYIEPNYSKYCTAKAIAIDFSTPTVRTINEGAYKLQSEINMLRQQQKCSLFPFRYPALKKEKKKENSKSNQSYLRNRPQPIVYRESQEMFKRHLPEVYSTCWLNDLPPDVSHVKIQIGKSGKAVKPSLPDELVSTYTSNSFKKKSWRQKYNSLALNYKI